ncbi:MAG: type IV pilus assembly protein PilM [bacterium]
MFNPLQMLIPKKFLGIDIGTSYIKIMEISRFGHRRKLENYGCLCSSVLYQTSFRTFEKNTLLLSSQDIAKAIKAIVQEAKIKTRQAIFSIPDFSTFFTSFELPPMTREELPQAVRYEAKLHVPMPLGEVTLDWQVIGGEISNNKKSSLRVLLVAVPNEVINQYREIAAMAGLELVALEAEVFGLIRSLIDKDDKDTLIIIDIGAQSTSCNVIDKRVLKLSHSFDMSGNELTKVISQGLSIGTEEAEELKQKQGLIFDQNSKTREILLPLIDVILRETEQVVNKFSVQKERAVQKIILAGGSALLPGLKEYFSEQLKKEVIIADPFTKVFYPPILEKALKKMGPGYAIAVGMSLRGLEY